MATSYREVIVKGDDTLLRGFVWGFKAARKIKSGVLFCADHPIQTHHLREILTLHGNYVHLITSGQHHRAILAALKQAAHLEFEVVSDKAIRKTYFDFKFQTFNRDVAAKLKRVLRRLPAGLKLVDFEPEETVEPSAKGVEFYSPVHDYCYEGTGKAQGEVEKLLRFHRALGEHVFIETEDIEVEH